MNRITRPHSSDFVPSFNASSIGPSKLSGFVVLAQRPLTCYTTSATTHAWKKAGRTYPIPAHQELLEIPLDPLEAQQARDLRLHPLVHGLGLVAVDVRLAQHRERHPVVAQAEALDGVVVAGVLLHELVAGEAQDDEAVRVLGLDLLVELLETFKLRREAAFGGGVDDQDDFVLEAGEGIGLAFLCWRGGVSARPDAIRSRGRGGGRAFHGAVEEREKVEDTSDVLSRGLKS